MDVTGGFQRATAWAEVDGRFAFMVGPDATGERLGVVRLGGALEAGETPWAGACRELMEEASLTIEHVEPPCTYRVDEEGRLEATAWQAVAGCPRPIIFSPNQGVGFLARSTDEPRPAGESHGLLLLSPSEVIGLCEGDHTLRRFLEQGGLAVYNPALPNLDEEMMLDPKGPCVMKRVLELHPDLSEWCRLA